MVELGGCLRSAIFNLPAIVSDTLLPGALRANRPTLFFLIFQASSFWGFGRDREHSWTSNARGFTTTFVT